MTKEEIRIACAEACGLIMVKLPFNPNKVKVGHNGDWFSPEAGQWIVKNFKSWASPKIIPNYPEDLNACHEMEEGLTKEQRLAFLLHLGEIVIRGKVLGEKFRNWPRVHATAAQRCEAFLRTIGKWKD